MESKKLSENISDLAGNVKEYLLLQLDLVKLLAAEKLSALLGALILAAALFMILMFLLTFLSVSFVLWYSENVGQAYVGALIMAGFYLVLGLVLYFLRITIVINPLISQFTKILLEKKDESKQ